MSADTLRLGDRTIADLSMLLEVIDCTHLRVELVYETNAQRAYNCTARIDGLSVTGFGITPHRAMETVLWNACKDLGIVWCVECNAWRGKPRGRDVVGLCRCAKCRSCGALSLVHYQTGRCPYCTDRHDALSGCPF